MNRDALISLLLDIKNAKREYRVQCATQIINAPALFPILLHETFNVNNKLSIKSAWVLEWICTHHGLLLLSEHLDFFTKNLNILHFDGALRSAAKICEKLGESYHTQEKNRIASRLTSEQIHKIIEVSFDWLITPQKIAVKAYAMTTLYHFGFFVDWVHDELKNIIINDVIHYSKGCEARGRKVLLLLEKKVNLKRT